MPLPLDELVSHPELVNPRAQELDWEGLLFEYELALDDIQAWLRGMNEQQIHFKPAEIIYSIAEIVTHNSFSDEMFWSWIALLVQGRGTEIDPKALISGGGARNIATLRELDALNEACRTLARHTIDSLPGTPNLATTTPHPYFGELNAKGWIYFMALHRGVHRYQCESVVDAAGFPRSESLQSLSRDEYLQPSNRKTWLSKQGAVGQKQRKSKSKSKAVSKESVGSTTKPKSKARTTASKKH